MINLLLGDCLERLRELPDASVDACVTDPPYGLSFMGKGWDHSVPSVEVWREVWRVLKPGAHLLAFFGTRTYHRGVVAIEDAGFEIRDQIGWAFGSGFPKSLDLGKALDVSGRGAMVRAKLLHFAAQRGVDGAWLETHGVASGASFRDWTVGGHVPSEKNWQLVKGALGVTPDEESAFEREVLQERTMTQGGGSSLQIRMGELREVSVPITAPATPEAQRWQGWGTALKPAWEPIVVARKPLEGTVAANVLAWGTGAINVDGCRVGHDEACRLMAPSQANIDSPSEKHRQAGRRAEVLELKPEGRWPANLIHDGSDEVVGLFPVTGPGFHPASRAGLGYSGQAKGQHELTARKTDAGSAARFFYCAKASRADREDGLWEFEPKRSADRQADDLPGGDNPRNRTNQARTNHHPTVKPTDLMRYLCRLVTPPGGVVLDPFMGSGSTGRGAVLEGFSFIGCELDPEYLEIARARITAVSPEPEPEPQAPAPAGQLRLW